LGTRTVSAANRLSGGVAKGFGAGGAGAIVSGAQTGTGGAVGTAGLVIVETYF
jgi:hypothetical protein